MLWVPMGVKCPQEKDAYILGSLLFQVTLGLLMGPSDVRSLNILLLFETT